MDNLERSRPIRKWVTIIILDLILLILVILFFSILHYFSHSHIKIDGVFIDHPREIADFNLIDQHGQPFTKEQLKGHWTLLFFGFTRCPMVCPTTFFALNKMYLLLQKQLPPHLLPLVVFITIDPKNDTIERLNQYVNLYNTRFIGARTDINKTISLGKQLSISVVNLNDTLDHNTDILILNPQAQIQAYLFYPHHAEHMARDYQLVLNHLKI